MILQKSLQLSFGDVDVMLVEHLPFMELLTAYLITGSSDNIIHKKAPKA
jgi:phosphohistidine phosphatase SixA